MTDATTQTKRIHAAYQHMTGLTIPFTMQLHYRLEHWVAEGGTLADLQLVVRYLKRRIREGKRPMESLLPRNLFSNYSNFLEDLSIAKAEARNAFTDPAKEQVLRESGRPSITSTEPKSAASLLAGCQALAQFREWRSQNGL